MIRGRRKIFGQMLVDVVKYILIIIVSRKYLYNND